MPKIALTFWVKKLHFRFICNACHQLPVLIYLCMQASVSPVLAKSPLVLIISACSSKTIPFSPSFCLLCESAWLCYFLIFKDAFLQNFYPVGCRQSMFIQWFQTFLAAASFSQVRTQALRWKTNTTEQLCLSLNPVISVPPPEFPRKPWGVCEDWLRND